MTSRWTRYHRRVAEMSRLCLQRTLMLNSSGGVLSEGVSSFTSVTVSWSDAPNVQFHQETEISSISLWTLVHLEKRLRSSEPARWCPVSPGLADAVCCSSSIQSFLTGCVCVHLEGAQVVCCSTGTRAALHRQLEIIKSALGETCDVRSHARHALVPTQRSCRVP